MSQPFNRGLPGPVGWAAEFARRTDRANYIWRGTCGQVALSVSIRAAKGWSCGIGDIQAYMDYLARDMIARNLASDNGAATLASLANEAAHVGASIFHQQNYWENMPASVWHDGYLGIDGQAGYRPIILQVANGRALIDSQSNIRDEPNLNYHAIAIVGANAQKGFIVADGDSALANSRFQYYTRATLDAARPCGLLILNMQR